MKTLLSCSPSDLRRILRDPEQNLTSLELALKIALQKENSPDELEKITTAAGLEVALDNVFITGQGRVRDRL